MENRWPQFYSSPWNRTKTQEKNRTKVRKANTKSSKFTFFASVKCKAIMINIQPKFFPHFFFCTDW